MTLFSTLRRTAELNAPATTAAPSGDLPVVADHVALNEGRTADDMNAAAGAPGEVIRNHVPINRRRGVLDVYPTTHVWRDGDFAVSHRETVRHGLQGLS